MANLNWSGLFKGPESLIAVAQDLTVNWVDLGAQQFVRGAQAIALHLNLDINNSQNARVRMLVSHASAGDEYTLPIRTVGAASVAIEPEVLEFNVDEDRLMTLSWDLDGVIAYVQFQVQVSAVGVAAGQILSANVTTSARA